MPRSSPLDDGGDRGWATPIGIEPWLPFPPEADHRNYDSQRGDRASILHLYRRLLALRRETPALSAGRFELVDTPEGVLGYRRRSGDDAWVVLVNFTDQVIEAKTDDGAGTATWLGGLIRLSSDGVDEGGVFDGRLAGDQAVVVQL